MNRLLFGTGGVPLSSKRPDTVSGLERLRQLGLDCLELEFVNGVRMGVETAAQVAEAGRVADIRCSVHAPYYINLCSTDSAKVAASRTRILDSARIGGLCGATSVVFHPAFYQALPHEKAYEIVKQHLTELADFLRAQNSPVDLRPEVTGRPSQFGDLDEVLFLCRDVEGVQPCVDFAHLHARTGANNSHAEFLAILQRIEAVLGPLALQTMHIHVSGIEYGAKGEKRHLPLDASDFNFKEFLQAMKDMGAAGRVVCESPALEVDALRLQETYAKLS